MARKIRADLVGMVHVHIGDDLTKTVALAAGDEVPDGATVGDHLLTPGDDVETQDDDSQESAGAPKGNASTDEWAAYAAKLGVEVPDGAKRDDIQALIAQAQEA